jgi:hypothetical protein
MNNSDRSSAEGNRGLFLAYRYSKLTDENLRKLRSLSQVAFGPILSLLVAPRQRTSSRTKTQIRKIFP